MFRFQKPAPPRYRGSVPRKLSSKKIVPTPRGLPQRQTYKKKLSASLTWGGLFVVSALLLFRLSSNHPAPAATILIAGNSFNQPWYFDSLHIQRIWDTYTTGNPNVIVAVIDEGIDITDPDLIGSI